MSTTDVSTLALAVATVALAVFTAVLAWQTRQARVEAEKERRRASFRAALVEALDNCRWWSEDPAQSVERAMKLAGHEARFPALERFLADVNLPAPVLHRLVWMVGATRERVGEVARLAREAQVPGIIGYYAERAGRDVGYSQEALASLRDEWLIAIDQLQTILCMVRCESRRQGFADVAEGFSGSKWLVPKVMAVGRLSDEVASVHSLNAPPFPSDVAYAECSPGVRDAAAVEANAMVVASRNADNRPTPDV